MRGFRKRFFRHKKVHSKVFFEGFEYDEKDINYQDNVNIPLSDEKTDLIVIYIMILMTLIEVFGFLSKNVY